MITKEKLEIYKKYLGDIDAWARVGKKREHEIMNDEDWSVIEGLIQDFELVEKELVSSDLKSKIYKRLEETCDNKETKDQLKSLMEN